MRTIVICAVLALGLMLAPATKAAERTFTVVVTSNGWHTDIAIARADIPAGRIPESADFPDARYLQFGWGDKDFYTTPDPGLFTTLGAAFAGPAVVHVAGLSALPSATFRDIEEIALTLDETNFTALVDHLHESFDRAGAARAESTAPGVYAFSRFYPATGEFHLFNTCNTWTAEGLAAAGLDVPATQSADDLMRSLRKATAEAE